MFAYGWLFHGCNIGHEVKLKYYTTQPRVMHGFAKLWVLGKDQVWSKIVWQQEYADSYVTCERRHSCPPFDAMIHLDGETSRRLRRHASETWSAPSPVGAGRIVWRARRSYEQIMFSVLLSMNTRVRACEGGGGRDSRVAFERRLESTLKLEPEFRGVARYGQEFDFVTASLRHRRSCRPLNVRHALSEYAEIRVLWVYIAMDAPHYLWPPSGPLDTPIIKYL